MIQDSNIPPEGFENEAIWLPKLFVNSQTIQSVTFRNCRLLGPAVVALLGSTQMSGCSFPSPMDSFLWHVPEERGAVYGAMGFIDCSFIGCLFEPSVGLAVDDQLMAMIQSGIDE